MTDWWRTQYPQAEGASLLAIPERPEEPDPPELPVAVPSQVPEEPEPPRRTPSRRERAVKVAGGVVGVALLGALAINAASKGDEARHAEPTAVEQEQDLPAAGNGPGVAVPEKSGTASKAPAVPQETVTLTAEPSGKGRVGAIVKVSIRNDTSDSLTVLATLVEGDGRPAVVGEGSLAPGSRVIEPGNTAEGTVEFSSSKPPGQVVLLDLSGNIVAASN